MNLLAILFLAVSLTIVIKFLLIERRKRRIEFKTRETILLAFVDFLRTTNSESKHIQIREEIERTMTYEENGLLFWYLIFNVELPPNPKNYDKNIHKRFIKIVNENGKEYLGREPNWSNDRLLGYFIGHQAT